MSINMSPAANLDSLLKRLDAVLAGLDRVEAAVGGVTPVDVLHGRQLAVLDRLSALEQACGSAASSAAAVPAPPVAAGAAATQQPRPQQQQPQQPQQQQQPRPAPALAKGADPDSHSSITDPCASEVQRRLARELVERGIVSHRFVRCPPEYYDRPLEFRRGVLDAHSVEHLCKTIVMENTRAHPSVDGWSDPHNSKYYMVIVQYCARLNAEKLKSHIHNMNRGKVGKKFFNMRLAPEAISDELSGFSHNAVSPIGVKTRLPIIMSHKILELQPDFFFMGGGEVDLKVGMSAAEFVEAYKDQPLFVVDCTYEEGENGGEEDAASGGQD